MNYFAIYLILFALIPSSYLLWKEECKGETPMEFYGKCVAGCPNNSMDSSLNLYLMHECICKDDYHKEEGGCVAGKCSNLNFYGKCMEECPSDSLEYPVVNNKYCLCDMRNSKVFNGFQCINAPDCTGGSGNLNFYGKCMATCPTHSAESTTIIGKDPLSHPGRCLCEVGKMPFEDKCIDQCADPTPLKFYGECVADPCPAHSSQSTNNMAHPEYCVCLYGTEILGEILQCKVSAQCSGTTPYNFYQKCIEECPKGATEDRDNSKRCFCDESQYKFKTDDGLKCETRNTLIDRSNPTAVITAISRTTITSNAPLKLSGRDSTNPNNDDTSPEGLDFYWSCANTDASKTACIGENEEEIPSGTTPTYDFLPNSFNPGRYRITLKVVVALDKSKVDSIDKIITIENGCTTDADKSFNFGVTCVRSCPKYSTATKNNNCICIGEFIPTTHHLACYNPNMERENNRPPIAKIRGYQTFIKSQKIVLSGANSINPMNQNNAGEGLIYLWECFTDREMTSPCSFHITSIKDPEFFIIPPNIITPGDYTIRLTVSIERANNLKDSTVMEIKVMEEGEGPLVSIIGGISSESNVVNPQMDSTFKIVFNKPTGKNGDSNRPELPSMPGSHGLRRHLDRRPGEGGNHDTPGHKPGGGDNIPPHNIHSATFQWNIIPSIPHTIIKEGFFTIRKDTMQADTEYSLSCKVTLEGASTNVSIIIKAAKELKAGQLTSNLPQGMAHQTRFTFTADRFEGDDEEDILQYKFYMKVDGMEAPVNLNSKFTDKNTITTKLPNGRKPDYEITVIVIVENLLRMRARAISIVKVTPKNGGYSAKFISETLKEETETDSRIIDLGIFAPLITDEKEQIKPNRESKCRKCSETHGKCNETSGKCVCVEGYVGHDCSLTKTKLQSNKEILKTLVDSLSTIIDSENLDTDQTLTLLSAIAVCSAGATMGDRESNKKIEKIEEKMVKKFLAGTIQEEAAGNNILELISNSMEGIEAERSEITTTGTGDEDKQNRKELRIRKRSRINNLKRVSKQLLKMVAVGTKMAQKLMEHFEITGRVDKGESLDGTTIQTDNGPLVTLKGMGKDNIVIGLNYINIFTNLLTDSEDILNQLFTNTLTLEALDFMSGLRTKVENMQDPVVIQFNLLRKKREGENSPRCIYYEEIESEGEGEREMEISIDGVETLVESDTFITCKTAHFSEFAIIPQKEAILPDNMILEDGDGSNNQDHQDEDKKNYNILIIIICVVAVLLIIIGLAVLYIKKRVIYIYIYIYNI